MFIFHFQPISHKEGVIVHTGGCAFFPVTLVILVMMTAGCTSLPFFDLFLGKSAETIDIGFSSSPMAPVQGTCRFERLTTLLSGTRFEGEENTTGNATPDRQVLYIRGLRLGSTGEADNWMMVVRHGGNASLITCDKYGESISRWNTSITMQGIPMDRILTPAELLTRSHTIIFTQQNESDLDPMVLELSGSSYTLTITGRNKTSILTFNAITGALTDSHE